MSADEVGWWMTVLVVASRSCRSTACGTGATVTQPMRRRRHRADYGIASEEPRGYQVAAVCDLGCFKPSTRAVLKQPVLFLLPFPFCFSCFLLQIYQIRQLTFHLCVFFS